MPAVCARCGTENPENNRFCQSCGTPLVPASAQAPAIPNVAAAASPFTQPPSTPPGGWAVVAPPGAPAAAGPPGPPQPAYQSPYYTPAAGTPQPSVHRTPWMLIVAAIVALVVVVGGAGTGLALVLGRHNSQTSPFQALASPSPGGTPTSGHSPSPASTPGAQSAANAGLTVVLPKGWTVSSKDSETVTLLSPSGDGSVTVASGPSNPHQSALQNKDQLDKFFLLRFPDTKTCPGSAVSNGDVDGVHGIFWELCFTVVSGAQTVSIGAPLFVGANTSGSVYYAAMLQTSRDNMDKFIAEAKPILDGGVTWKLK